MSQNKKGIIIDITDIISPWARIGLSPWPVFVSFAFGGIFFNASLWFWGGEFIDVSIILAYALFAMYCWGIRLMREGIIKGYYTSRVGNGLKWSIYLFILSEAMFFFSFFWTFGHRSLVPRINFGSVWPPYGIRPIHPAALPLFNMGVLVWSSCTLNLSTGLMRLIKFKRAIIWAVFRFFLGGLFLLAQWSEYRGAGFTICDRVYGRIFFLLTGFHGFHVILGLSWILLNIYRLFNEHYHTGFNLCWMAGLWYWHFVDLIWIVIWRWIYCWGYL